MFGGVFISMIVDKTAKYKIILITLLICLAGSSFLMSIFLGMEAMFYFLLSIMFLGCVAVP